MNSVCVFCGSRAGAREDYTRAAETLGLELARRGLTLVYGGGAVGLMGTVADSTLAAGGNVVGIIPKFLNKQGIIHEHLTECLIVEDLFERKALMFERSGSCVALPGGVGTLDELLEAIAWQQLGQLSQGIGLVNVAGYFDRWIDALDHMSREGFVSSPDDIAIVTRPDPAALLDAMTSLANS